MADQEILAGPAETAEVNGTLGLNIYGNVGGTMQTVLSYAETGQVPSALAWLTGNFTGTENMGISNRATLGQQRDPRAEHLRERRRHPAASVHL